MLVLSMTVLAIDSNKWCLATVNIYSYSKLCSKSKTLLEVVWVFKKKIYGKSKERFRDSHRTCANFASSGHHPHQTIVLIKRSADRMHKYVQSIYLDFHSTTRALFAILVVIAFKRDRRGKWLNIC